MGRRGDHHGQGRRRRGDRTGHRDPSPVPPAGGRSRHVAGAEGQGGGLGPGPGRHAGGASGVRKCPGPDARRVAVLAASPPAQPGGARGAFDTWGPRSVGWGASCRSMRPGMAMPSRTAWRSTRPRPGPRPRAARKRCGCGTPSIASPSGCGRPSSGGITMVASSSRSAGGSDARMSPPASSGSGRSTGSGANWMARRRRRSVDARTPTVKAPRDPSRGTRSWTRTPRLHETTRTTSHLRGRPRRPDRRRETAAAHRSGRLLPDRTRHAPFRPGGPDAPRVGSGRASAHDRPSTRGRTSRRPSSGGSASSASWGGAGSASSSWRSIPS